MGNIVFVVLICSYVVGIASFLRVTLSDPGTLAEPYLSQWRAGEFALPNRAFKHWMYDAPVLRFHQHCRWTNNCVGLANHRSYILMMVAFTILALVDACIDGMHVGVKLVSFELASVSAKEASWDALIACHLCYCCYFGWYVVPLCKQHLGFASRNELTKDWQLDLYQVVKKDNLTVHVK